MNKKAGSKPVLGVFVIFSLVYQTLWLLQVDKDGGTYSCSTFPDTDNHNYNITG